MDGLLATAGAAAALFAVTNIDDMMVLAVLNATSRAAGRSGGRSGPGSTPASPSWWQCR
jgi:hypothetical protein